MIFLKEVYTSPSLLIHAGYINQEKKANGNSKISSIKDVKKVVLFFQVKSPNMLFTLRTYGSRYMHVINNIFCVTLSPIGAIQIMNDELSDLATQKVQQWVRHELNLLGLN